jgi:pimeloyl-ACP methyl ester carboxylesterase
MNELPRTLSFHEPAGLKARATLIVIPGRGEQPEVYRRFGSRLAFDAYRVHVVSDPTAAPDVVHAQILDRLAAADVEPLVLAGSDTGALFAVALARQVPTRVAGLLLAGLPTARESHEQRDWPDELDARTSCPTHRSRITDPALLRRGAVYEPVPAGWIEEADIADIAVPILAIHGQEDSIAPFPTASTAYAACGTAEIVAIANAPHDVLNDQTHRTVAATVVLWLERLRLGGSLASIAVPHPAGPVGSVSGVAGLPL